MSPNLNNNSASHTGGAVVTKLTRVTYHDITVTGNSGTAIFIYRSNVSCIGNTTMSKNNGSVGGAITAEASSVYIFHWSHNPIAVLATLLLMSYTKILKTLIEIFSSVQLEYPGNKKVSAWFKDANIHYLKSQHLILAVVGSIFIAFFFLPYTIFLLLGYKLYYFSENRCLHWFMIRMKPLLDSYYAPYEKHTHYWTGLPLHHFLIQLAELTIAF